MRNIKLNIFMFLVWVSVSFTLHVCVFILFVVRFGLLSGHFLGKSCSLGWPYVLFVFWLFVILVISHLVLRVGLGFWLLQFLVFAYFYFDLRKYSLNAKPKWKWIVLSRRSKKSPRQSIWQCVSSLITSQRSRQQRICLLVHCLNLIVCHTIKKD